MPEAAARQSLRPLRPAQYQTLVLNADYRPLTSWPLSLISAQDAISALWRDRITVVESWYDAFFRSPSMIIAVPKIVALRQYAPVHGVPKCTRRNIYLRDRYRCQYCGERFVQSDLTYDHVIPRSKGGLTIWENILTACLDCNGKKADRMPNYSGRRGAKGSLRPLKMPRQPTGAELLRAGFEFLPNDLKENFGEWLYWNTELEP